MHAAASAELRHLRLVHTDDYLDSLSRPAALTRLIGLAVNEEVTERILQAQRFMAGGTLAAARLALASGGIGVNLGGGLHHAFADKGERFCAYNDVAVAIAALRAEGVRSRILVVDLDLHDGDGTRAIFAEDPSVHTLSIHNQTSWEGEAVEATVVELGHGVDEPTYLAAVRDYIPPVIASFRPELAVYLAGCDPAVDDQIGDWTVSARGLLERDLFVVDALRGRERKIPLTIVLAGGYGMHSWSYSARFFSALLNRGRAIEPPTTEETTLIRYRRLATQLDPRELTGESASDDWGLTEDDLAASLAGPHRTRRFLGYYSREGLELTLERAGLFDRIRHLGFHRPSLELDLDNPTGDTVRVFGEDGRRDLLIELRARVDRGTLPGLSLLRIEWMLLQNPRAQFTRGRPRLPGQSHPGLGMLQDILALLVLACDRLQLDGFLFVPAHYHTAAQGRKSFRFLDPEHEGLLRALNAVLHDLPLDEAAQAVAEGRVIDEASGQPFAWPPMPMVFPVSPLLRAWFEQEGWDGKVAAAEARHRFRLAGKPARMV